jgi:leucyl aminopeptidase
VCSSDLVATPDYVARKLKEIASRAKLKCTILDEKQLRKQGFNALLSVASGSAQPPKLVVVEYHAGKGRETIALVGKGITFDSGGISLKIAQDMDKMKFDKSGACTVVAVASAAKALKLPVNVIAIAPLSENVPSGTSYKPGDVVTGISGKSIEVLNTDAEGRIILSDALSYAVKKYKPKTIIDVATLTGACIIALGDGASGMLSNDDELAKDLYDAGQASGDKVWRLPMWDEYAEKIKSDVGDVKNTGDGTAGTITATMFLKNFVELDDAKKKKRGAKESVKPSVKWAHLDIAGMAWVTKNKPYFAIGATGAGTRVIIEYLLKKYGK